MNKMKYVCNKIQKEYIFKCIFRIYFKLKLFKQIADRIRKDVNFMRCKYIFL